MIILKENRNYEWPIVFFWYTKHKGKTIEELIDKDVHFFEWAVSQFQNVTPSQASYYHKVTGRKVPKEAIQDVEPYEWKEGDPEESLYMKICKTQDLHGTLRKYRGEQLSMF